MNNSENFLQQRCDGSPPSKKPSVNIFTISSNKDVEGSSLPDLLVPLMLFSSTEPTKVVLGKIDSKAQLCSDFFRNSVMTYSAIIFLMNHFRY